MRKTTAGTLASLALAATAGTAQISYIAPGSLGELAGGRREQILQAYQQARWSLGPIELEPSFSIGDLSYVSNVYSSAEGPAVSDLRGGASAGLRAFFNLGPKVVVSPFADLSYAWWKEQDELRTLSESFGLQLFADLNRLQAQLQVGRLESQRNLSSEVEVPVNPRSDRAQLDLELELGGPLRLFAGAARNEVRFSGAAAERQVDGLRLSSIDSDGERLTGGLSYELGNGLTIGLGYLRSETTFLDDRGGRSRRSAGPLARIDFEGQRLSLRLEASQSDVEIAARAGGDDREQLDGVVTLRWRIGQRLSTRLYSGAQLNSSALDDEAIFESRRNGAVVAYETPRRGTFSAFYEIGEDEYATAASDLVTRLDDFTSYGAGYRLLLTARWSLELAYSSSRRDSSDPLFERDLETLSFRLNLGGNLLPWRS